MREKIAQKLAKNAQIVYSQEGEDLIVNRLLEDVNDGFFVDIGAHHPVKFSNTYLLYKRGWSGINVDAMPGSMKMFNRIRKRDINVESGVGKESGVLTFYVFEEPALNTFDADRMKYLESNTKYRHVDEKQVNILTLKEILDKYVPADTKIDYMDIDVEGLDMDVLVSNDWTKYRPNIVSVESTLCKDVADCMNTEVAKFMFSKDYRLFSRLYNTLIFIDATYLDQCL